MSRLYEKVKADNGRIDEQIDKRTGVQVISLIFENCFEIAFYHSYHFDLAQCDNIYRMATLTGSFWTIFRKNKLRHLTSNDAKTLITNYPKRTDSKIKEDLILHK